MNIKKILFYILAGILGGCVPVMSLHPLYTEKDTSFDDRILGTWLDDSNESQWEFTRPDKTENKYKLTIYNLKEKHGMGLLDVYLVKLKNKLYLDVSADEFPCDVKDANKVDWPLNAFFLVPAHTFLKIELDKDELNLMITDDESMKKLLKDEPNSVGFEELKDSIVLTSKTKNLQEFVIKYADDKRLFSGKTPLKRKEQQKTKDVSASDANSPKGKK
jgi:hypothetical protein